MLRRRPGPSTYEEQTHGSPYWIVRWPHEERFRLAQEEIAERRPTTFLDYGAGDGHVIEGLFRSGRLPPRTVAYEPVDMFAEVLKQTVERCGIEDRVTIARTVEECLPHTFDCISCLAVLEHMPLPQRRLFYELCDRTLATDGVGVIDVPVETGPTVVVKEVARRVLKKREPEYSNRALVERGLGIAKPDPVRHDPDNADTWIHFHTGFDHRILRNELAERFAIRRTYGTPLRWLPPQLGNQEFFIVFGRQAAPGR